MPAKNFLLNTRQTLTKPSNTASHIFTVTLTEPSTLVIVTPELNVIVTDPNNSLILINESWADGNFINHQFISGDTLAAGTYNVTINASGDALVSVSAITASNPNPTIVDHFEPALTKVLALKVETKDPLYVSFKMEGIYDIDDNKIMPIAVYSSIPSDSSGDNPNNVMNGLQYGVAKNSVILFFVVAENSPDINYVKFISTTTIKRVSLLVDKTGTGDHTVLTNWITSKSTTSLVKNNSYFIYRVGLTKTALAEKLILDAIKTKTKRGDPVTVPEALNMLMSTSEEGDRAYVILQTGGGYDELRLAGLTDLEAYIALAIINIQVDSNRYESEQALNLITTSITALGDFLTYLTTNNKTLPSLSNIAATIRANAGLYALLKPWRTQYSGS